MDCKKLADDLLSYCHLNCSACEYAGDALECTIKQLASTAITDLLARAEEAEQRCKELEARCKRLDEAREIANEAAAKWEGAYKLALERAEKAEKEKDACCYDQDSGETAADFFQRLLQSMDELKRAYEVAVQDLETIMLQGGKDTDICAYCRNAQCYVRGGRDCCTPIWRGRDKIEVAGNL